MPAAPVAGRAVLVALVCDAGRTEGVGHLMRCLALAEELADRGVVPVLVADLDGLEWGRRQVAARGLRWVAPGADPVATVESLGADAVVLDSYLLPPTVSGRLRAAGLPVLALVDGDHRDQIADIYLDQNLGAEHDVVTLPVPGVRLAGLRYVLHRTDVLRHRPAEPRRGGSRPPRVLAFFGGTDPYGAAPVLAAALAATGVDTDQTIVAATPARADEIAAVRLPVGSRRVLGPTDELPRLVTGADVVIAASGTSAWELACLGAAAALVCVADNQRVGYARAVATGIVVGLGELSELRADPTRAVPALRRLLTDQAARYELRSAAWRLVDGEGRRRVADALLARLPTAPTPAPATATPAEP